MLVIKVDVSIDMPDNGRDGWEISLWGCESPGHSRVDFQPPPSVSCLAWRTWKTTVWDLSLEILSDEYQVLPGCAVYLSAYAPGADQVIPMLMLTTQAAPLPNLILSDGVSQA